MEWYKLFGIVYLVLFGDFRRLREEDQLTDLRSELQEYKSLAKATEVERDRLMELLQLTQKRYVKVSSCNSLLKLNCSQCPAITVDWMKRMNRLSIIRMR